MSNRDTRPPGFASGAAVIALALAAAAGAEGRSAVGAGVCVPGVAPPSLGTKAAPPPFGGLTCVSVTSAGIPGTGGGAQWASLSGDGRYVTFYDAGTDLVPGYKGVFHHDRLTGQTVNVNVSITGGPSNVATVLRSSVSEDGRLVAFSSPGNTLVGFDTNDREDVFVRDMDAGITTRVSVSSSGGQGDGISAFPSISPDGRFVAFQSQSTNLVPGDTNGKRDVFLHDRLTAATTRVSVSSTGAQSTEDSGSASVDRFGRHVAMSGLPNLGSPPNGNLLVHDVQSGTTIGVGIGFDPVLSDDGRFLAYLSSFDVPALGDTNGSDDVFVHDLVAGTTELASVSSSGAPGDSNCGSPSISGDGRYVAFRSNSSNLAPGVAGGGMFVRDRQAGTTQLVAAVGDGVPAISADGRAIAFSSWSTALVPGDLDAYPDVFVREQLLPPDPGTWVLLGGGTYGNAGKPVASASGAMQAGVPATFGLSNAPPFASALLLASSDWLALPVGKGMLWPQPTVVLPLATDSSGAVGFTVPWPALPALFPIVVQFAVADPAAAGGKGFTLSNAAWGISQ